LLPELPEFEAAAFALPTNQVSDIVTTKVGYHIIKVLEKTPAKMTELEKVADTIRQILKAQEIRKLAPAYFEKLKQEANVEILDKNLKAVNLPTPADQDAGK
jgi:peptidyl-prolyl cis-trans isomerase C